MKSKNYELRIKKTGRCAVLALLCFLNSYFLILNSAVAGNTNYFAFTNAEGIAISNTDVTLTPHFVQIVNGFNTVDRLTFTTTNDGSFLATNLLPGTYDLRINNSFFQINVPNSNGFLIATNFVSGIQQPGTTAVYTRAQADARYFQVTNAHVAAMTASNTTFTGLTDFSSTTSTNGTFEFPTNISGVDSNVTILSEAIAGPVSYGAATTNLATLTASYTISGPTNLLPGAATNTTVTLSGVGTNGDWFVGIAPGWAFTNTASNVVVTVEVVATNTLLVQFINASSNIINNIGTNNYRVEARKWQQ